MTLAIDASRAISHQKTGVEWYAWHLIMNLKETIPATVRVVLYVDKNAGDTFGQLPPNWEINILRWPPKRFWTQIRLSWEMFRHPPDVLFVPAHVMPLVHPKKTVVTVHDVAALRFPESYSWFERWYSLWSARFAVRHAWKIIVPSEFTKNELEESLSLQKERVGEVRNVVTPPPRPELGTKADLRLAGEGSQKRPSIVQVIPHGYDASYQNISDEVVLAACKEKYKIKQSYMISMGRLEEKKNTARIVEAFSLLKQMPDFSDVQLVLIGKPGYGYEKVKTAMKNSTYRHDIIETGWIPNEDARCLLNSAEAFVFPSLYEGFGLSVLEAFACGIPVVTSRGSSLQEVGGNAAVYVDPLDVKSIKEEIEKILRDNVLVEELIRKGKEQVKNFSWEKCADETMDILIAHG